MATTRRNVAVGVFEQEAQAEKAVAALFQAGFPHDCVDMATRDQGVVPGTPRLEIQKDAASGAEAGAVAGAASGLVAGALAGSLIPGVGTLLGGLGGAALGAAGGTFAGPFLALDMSEDEAHHYSRAVDQGRILVVVREPSRLDEARTILRNHGAREEEVYPVPTPPI
jgi:hypothetical protein